MESETVNSENIVVVPHSVLSSSHGKVTLAGRARGFKRAAPSLLWCALLVQLLVPPRAEPFLPLDFLRVQYKRVVRLRASKV